MKAFEFSLQRVLEAREALARKGEQQLAQNLRLLKRTEEELEKIEESMSRQVRLLRAGFREKSNIHEVSGEYGYIDFLRKQKDEALERISEAQKQVKLARMELLRLTRDRKSLERLREREKQEWLVSQKRAERIQMDELASVKFFYES